MLAVFFSILLAAQVLEVLQNQPDDSFYKGLLRGLAFAQMVERGLVDSDAGRPTTHEDQFSRIRSCPH